MLGLAAVVQYGRDSEHLPHVLTIFSRVTGAGLVSDIAIFVLKRDVKLQLTN